MHRFVILAVTALALLLAAGSLQCGDSSAVVDADPTSFEWLSGMWVMDTPDGLVVETWGKDSNWVYHGTGVTIKGGNRVSIEKMRIQQSKDLGMEFIADVPHNKSEVTFKLVSGGDASMRFVFENLAHDFPQRVIYHYHHLDAGDSLYARVEGMVDGKLEGMDFAYGRKR